MPGLSGGDFLRTVRSPDKFPFPETPIIVVSGHSEQKVVTEAFCAGVNEYLIKPVSPNSLRERMVQILVYPRKMVKVGAYYGPEPRKSAALLLQPQKSTAAPYCRA
jgi:CheY-like chemotaxis protein